MYRKVKGRVKVDQAGKGAIWSIPEKIERAGKQDGDDFYWKTVATDFSGSSSANTPANVAIRVPSGIRVKAYWQCNITNTGAAINLQFRIADPGVADVTLTAGGDAKATNGSGNSAAAVVVTGSGSCWTNTSSQVRITTDRGTSTTTVTAAGYYNPRSGNV